MQNNSSVHNGLKTFDVAIVLINYNGLNDTNECIESINQTTQHKPFIVVLDNASKDSPVIKDQLVNYPHLHLILQSTNIGFGRANNEAINWVLNNVDCKYIFILNNDTILSEGLIDNLTTHLANAANDVALASPRIMVYANPSEIWYGGGDIDLNKMTAVIDKSEHAASDSPHFTNFASGCAMFFKTEALRKFGGFDPFYFMYDEDVELSLNITQNAYKILYIPDAILYHKCQGSQVKTDNAVPENQLDPAHPSLLFYLRNTIINRRYTLKKHLTENTIKTYLKFNLYWFAKSAQYLLHGKLKAFSITLKSLASRLPNHA